MTAIDCVVALALVYLVIAGLLGCAAYALEPDEYDPDPGDIDTWRARAVAAIALWPITLPIFLLIGGAYGAVRGGAWMARNLKLWRIPLEIHQHRRGDE